MAGKLPVPLPWRVYSGMAVLDEESRMTEEMEIQKQSEGTKTSSLATIRRREDDAEMGKETGIIATSRPRGAGDSVTEDGGDGGGGSELKDDASDDDGLPLSKARCIALVATVTGAAFLNVSKTSTLSYTRYKSSHIKQNRPSPSKASSSSSPPSATTSPCPKAGSSGSSRPTRSPLAASCSSGAASPTCTASGSSLSWGPSG